MDKAIGLCYALKQELNYVIRTLPVNINKFESFAKLIDKQIELYKKVRQNDNKLITINTKKFTIIEDNIVKILQNVFDMICKIEL